MSVPHIFLFVKPQVKNIMTAEKNGKVYFSNIAGIQVRYRIRGEGPPLFFVHGLLGNIEQEDLMAGGKARLAEKYTVIHYDGRGRGQTEPGSFDTKHYTWEGLAEDLWALMRHVGVDRARFVGGSQGAAVVLAIAVRHPESVEAIVLHNPPEVRQLEQKYIRGMLDYADYIEENGMDVVTDLILSLPPNDRLRVTHPELIAAYDSIMRAQDARVVAAATRGTVCSEPMTRAQLQKIAAPALVISSEGDGLHPTELARFLLESIPKAEGLLGDSLTYFSENPDMVPKRIMDFLAKVDGTKWEL